MKRKRLSIEELEKLPLGTKVGADCGMYYHNYIIGRDSENKLCLRDDYLIVKLFYQDILKMDIYESTKETPVQHIDSFGVVPYMLTSNDDITKKMLDDWSDISWGNTSENTIYKEYFDKPQKRITREFNIAKKKEFEVPKKTREQRLKYIVAHVEINIDKALESGNKNRFIMLTNKLKEFRKACEVI